MGLLNVREIISQALIEYGIRITYAGLYDFVRLGELPPPIRQQKTVINGEGVVCDILDVWLEEDVSAFLAAKYQ